MKPAPFEKTKSNPANKSPYIIALDPDREETRVLHRSSEKLVWKMPVFIGRKTAYVSLDGKTLIAYGNEYFGDIIRSEGNPDLAVVYTGGNQTDKITFKQVFGRDIADLCKERKLPVFGGDWVGLDHFVKALEVDWKKKSLVFTLYDKSKKTLSFK